MHSFFFTCLLPLSLSVTLAELYPYHGTLFHQQQSDSTYETRPIQPKAEALASGASEFQLQGPVSKLTSFVPPALGKQLFPVFAYLKKQLHGPFLSFHCFSTYLANLLWFLCPDRNLNDTSLVNTKQWMLSIPLAVRWRQESNDLIKEMIFKWFLKNV